MNTDINKCNKNYNINGLPNSWIIKKMEDICLKNFVGIATATTQHVCERGVPLIRNQNIKENKMDDSDVLFITKEFDYSNKNKRLETDDILTVRTGYAGISCVVPAKYNGAQTFTTLVSRPNKDIVDPFYLCYYLNSDVGKSKIDVLLIGAAQKNFNVAMLEIVDVILPTMPEQTKITNILFTWDKAIELKEKLIEEKKKQKSGLMQKLLTGKVRLPGFDGEWKEYHIDDIAKQATHKNTDNSVTKVLSCTKYNGLVDSLEYFGRQMFSEDLSTYKVVKKGEICYATNHIEEGSIGILKQYEKGVVSPMYTVFSINKEFENTFVFLVLKSEKYVTLYQSLMSASVNRRGSLRWNEFKKIKIKCPNIEEQRVISEFYDLVEKSISLLEKELEALKQQKKGLMQLLLTGIVRVNVETN